MHKRKGTYILKILNFKILTFYQTIYLKEEVFSSLVDGWRGIDR